MWLRELPRRRFRTPAAAAGIVAALCVCAPAQALAPPSPWDGTNPFHCTIQEAGSGTSVPDPAADPYCVHFDKTGQNISQLGIVDFLLKEPARVAAATPKCFYFQEDDWRGSVVQSDGSSVLYQFTGHYFFDEATGDGGAWVTGFTVAGQTFDPTSLPGFPPAYGPDFGPGTGGVITHDQVPANPRCVALAARPGAVYAPAGTTPRCLPASGVVTGAGAGPLALGMGEDRVRALAGPPVDVQRGFLRYCVSGGGELAVGQPGDRSGTLGSAGTAPTVMLVASSRGWSARGRRGRRVAVGAGRTALARAFPHAGAVLRLGRTRVWRLASGVLATVAGGRVSTLVSYDPRAIAGRGQLRSYLLRGGS